MKKILFAVLLACLAAMDGQAQPVELVDPLASVDFDKDGGPELWYRGFASRTRELPETWNVSFGIEPMRGARLVRAASNRLLFHLGESISSGRGALTNYFPDPPRPPSESYGVMLLFYRAIMKANWEYSTAQPAFESESELLFGLRFFWASGIHHGWIRFSRPVLDNHTQFDLVDYAVHPVPDEPIAAGQPPPLPPIQTRVESASLTFSWDTRWGPLLLESTTNLAPPITWETFVEGTGGPVAVPTEDDQRFYRLRQP